MRCPHDLLPKADPMAGLRQVGGDPREHPNVQLNRARRV